MTDSQTPEAAALAVLRRHLPNLDAAAMPTKCEVFVVCGFEAAEMRDAIESLSAPSPIPAAPSDVAGLLERLRTSADAIRNDPPLHDREGDPVTPVVEADELARAAALIESLSHDREVMREALDELQDVFAHDGENSIERFDRLAAMFDRDTGYMAPGKSRPMHRCDQPDGLELHRIYDEWFAAKVTRARAALASLKGGA
jgi:hypothetical protein